MERGGVRFVEKLNPDGTTSMIKDKEEMELEIAESNMK